VRKAPVADISASGLIGRKGAEFVVERLWEETGDHHRHLLLWAEGPRIGSIRLSEGMGPEKVLYGVRKQRMVCLSLYTGEPQPFQS